MSSVTGGRKGVPPPTTTGWRNRRSSSTRPSAALNAVERAAEDDLRESAPDVGERGPRLVTAHRRIRLPRQHGLVQPAAAQKTAELARLRDVETKLLRARDRPPEPTTPAAGDETVHRDAHRVDQHGCKPIAPERRTMIPIKGHRRA